MATASQITAYETQQQIVALFRKKWWMFVLGSEFSAISVMNEMLASHQIKAHKEAVKIFDIQTGDTIRVVCIDSQYMPREVIVQALSEGVKNLIGTQTVEEILKDDAAGGPIFVPLSGKGTDAPPEVILQEGKRLHQLFDMFMHTFWPPPRGPLGLDPEHPVLIPNFMSASRLVPRVIVTTGFLETGHPTETHVRFFGWHLSDGTECSAVVTVELMDHTGMIQSDLLSRSGVVPEVESNLDALKQWAEEAIRVSVDKVKETRETYRLAAERKPQHGKERPPAGSQ